MQGIDKIWQEGGSVQISQQERVEAQAQDSVTNNMIQYLKTGKLPSKVREQRFVILRECNIMLAQGILYHLKETPSENEQLFGNRLEARIWVPRSLQVKCVKLAHEASGHCGCYKTLAFVRRKYIFPKMY